MRLKEPLVSKAQQAQPSAKLQTGHSPFWNFASEGEECSRTSECVMEHVRTSGVCKCQCLGSGHGLRPSCEKHCLTNQNHAEMCAITYESLLCTHGPSDSPNDMKTLLRIAALSLSLSIKDPATHRRKGRDVSVVVVQNCLASLSLVREARGGHRCVRKGPTHDMLCSNSCP